jgi:hypothetical protein
MISLFARLIGSMLCLLLVDGCAEFDSKLKKETPVVVTPPPAPTSEADVLLEFGANLANMPQSERAENCRSLTKKNKEAPDTRLALQLMVGRLLSDACGDISKTLEAVDAIPPEQLTEKPIRDLIDIHTEALKRIQTTHRKLASMERKQKTVQTVLESKDDNESSKNEANLLREKLEAIRSMEKQLDESVDGK